MATNTAQSEPQCDPTISSSANTEIDVALDVLINAPRERVFDAIVQDIDEWFRPGDMPGMNLILEAHPGGRLYRDMGDDSGHWWGTVQVIKPPELLEIAGPLFMSAPVASHISFRLEDDVDRTKLLFNHRAIGLIPDGALQNAYTNWTAIITKGLKDHVERNR